MKTIHGLPVPASIEDACDPRRMAMLIYDMQVGICSQVADAGSIVATIARVQRHCRDAAMPVAFTRHLSLPRFWMGAFQARMGMAWQHKDHPGDVEPWFLRQAPQSRIVPELEPRDDEVVFDKLAMSAFEGTPLSFAMRDRGLSCVAIAGIALEVGIEPTVRHAADLGFLPVVIADACGVGHAEAGHRSLEALRFSGDAIITDADTFCRILALGGTRS